MRGRHHVLSYPGAYGTSIARHKLQRSQISTSDIQPFSEDAALAPIRNKKMLDKKAVLLMALTEIESPLLNGDSGEKED